MMFGVLTVRLPALGWAPAGYVPRATSSKMITTGNVSVDTAFRTRQFWLLWVVLCMNVTAGIGVLGQASPMIQEIFPGRVTAIAAAGFVGLLSIFNMAGRFAWSSASDKVGRRNTYMIFFLLGFVLYALVPQAGRLGSVPLFIAAYAIILSMYGGGFATIPAYLKDIFGTMHVGAIHGRLLTAWSAAGLLGPQIVTYIREYELGHGVAKADAYNVTMYVMAGLLVVGFICNWLMTAVDSRHYIATNPTKV
jgi:MFS family permease